MARAELRTDVVDAVRALALESDRLGQAFAATHALHPTDWTALLHVMQAEGAGHPLTPGGLADLLDVSTGSATAVVDRLEKRGHLVRERDTADRRRVQLRYAEPAMRLAADFSGPLARQSEHIMAGMDDDQLALVHRFLLGMTSAMAIARQGTRGDLQPGDPP